MAFALAVLAVSGATAASARVTISRSEAPPSLHVRLAHATTATTVPQDDLQRAPFYVYPEAPVDLAVDIHEPSSTPDISSVSLPIPKPRLRPSWEGSAGLPSPAQRLGLSVKERAHAENCLAEAIYFEARGETVRGQVAIAQVIMNRVFSRFYPGQVCGVVYQNARRRHACQFSFACNGRRRVITNEGAWSVAQRIAMLALDGKIWEPDVGKATHYHAVWVHPLWIGTMHELARQGVHIFYRPEKWGDGSDEPNWSTVVRAMITAAN